MTEDRIDRVIRSQLEMIRDIRYSSALYAFSFTALWFVLGAVLLITPILSALGIGGEFFAVWLLLFFVSLGLSGFVLTAAALNTAFERQGTGVPTRRRTIAAPPRSKETLWAPPSSSTGAAPQGQRPHGPR